MADKVYASQLTANDVGKVIRFHHVDRAYVEDTLQEVRHIRYGAKDTRTLVRLAHLRPPHAVLSVTEDTGFFHLEPTKQVEVR